MVPLLYPLFYKQFGVRRIQNLLTPRLMNLEALPRNSFLHYVSNDHTNHDLDVSKLYFGPTSKRVLVDYPEELTSTLGNPKKKLVVLRTETRDFHRENTRFRYIREHYKSNFDQFTLVVNNYSYLDVIYRYVELPMTTYHRWFNLQKTIWDNAAKIAKESDRNQFFFVDLPKELPSYSLLRLYADKVNITITKIFDTPQKLFVLELWKWINENTRDKSIFSSLDNTNFSKINLVFNSTDGRVSIINLGYLNSWIKGHDNQTELNNVTQLDAIQIQKIFLKYLITLQSTLIEEVPVETVDPTQPAKDPLDIEEEAELQEGKVDYDHEHDLGEDHDELDNEEYKDLNRYLNSNDKKLKQILNDDIELSKLSSNEDNISTQLNSIDAELETLEAMTKKKLKEKGIHLDKNGLELDLNDVPEEELNLDDIKAEVFSYRTTEQVLNNQIDQYAEYGLISASDYKKLSKEIKDNGSRLDPYGSKKPIAEAMVISHQDIVIDEEKRTIVGSHVVKDPSMLKSSLQSFDYDYITKVLNKDVLNMVDGLQKAGVIVRDHEIETEHSAIGTYEIHTLQLKPIDGVPSTIRFRLPKISEDGTMQVGGSKYSLRKQRTDIPIRKINPYTVGLSSYYGKTFVTMSQKKANSSLAFIVKELNKATLGESIYITKVAPADVFDNTFNAPYIYNALANHVKRIETEDYTLVFDHTERSDIASGDVLPFEGKDGKLGRIVGFNKKLEVLTVDTSGMFYVHKGKDKLPIGTIYDVLQLSQIDAPVDFTEVRLFSKDVPLIVILGYSLGISKIIKLLDAKYRIVEGRKAKNLQNDEYAITFYEKSYIFSRKDKVASTILGGLLEYEKIIKQYSFEEFNKKDVYLNLLESKGLGSLYIREIELTEQLFVDPVTKSILEEMNEPVTFDGLLLRSNEMLQTYHHLDSQDLTAMRIRGYERIPGAVYKELVRAIRTYRNKNIAGRSKIDISPFEVWSTIMKDPALKIVEDINPIQNLKESEVVTYSGEGGRGKNSMVKSARAYHTTDIGVVSESTVDSSDVGVNAYLSADPNFKNLRGLVNNQKDLNATNVISTSALMAPGCDHDDPKRVNELI